MLHYVPEHLAPLTGQQNHLLFFPETLYFLQRGSWRKGAPSQPNSAHPEVNGAEGADWPRAPEPSRHTTGWGVGILLLHACILLFCCSLFLLLLFSLSHPAIEAGSHWNGKKNVKWRWGGGYVLFQTSRARPNGAQILKLDRRGGKTMEGMEWEMSWRGGGVGAQYMEAEGGGGLL